MHVVVPFGTRDPKSRLDPLLSPDERPAFARAMLDDVLTALAELAIEPSVLATDDVSVDCPVTVDERPLTPAVNAILAETDGPVAVVMADLALATPVALRRLFETSGDVVLVPGRAGGTNGLVARHPDFRTDYHGTSFLDHRAAAEELGVDVAIVDSYRLGTDVDEPADLVEVLVHGTGQAASWLRDAGFRLDRTAGRVGITRD